jgi:hypothetical protein
VEIFRRGISREEKAWKKSIEALFADIEDITGIDIDDSASPLRNRAAEKFEARVKTAERERSMRRKWR